MCWAVIGRSAFPQKKESLEADGKKSFNQGETPDAEAGLKFQALHHLMVASALANKAAKAINPAFQMGAMLALSGIYPATCHPEDVFGAYAFRRKALLFSDVLFRGEYPNYAQSIFDEYGFTLKTEQGRCGDSEVLSFGFPGILLLQNDRV